MALHAEIFIYAPCIVVFVLAGQYVLITIVTASMYSLMCIKIVMKYVYVSVYGAIIMAKIYGVEVSSTKSILSFRGIIINVKYQKKHQVMYFGNEVIINGGGLSPARHPRRAALTAALRAYEISTLRFYRRREVLRGNLPCINKNRLISHC